MRQIDEELKELDSMFSEIIRRGSADSNGYVTCITCGKRYHWKDVDLGHYLSRKHKVTRYDERNVGCQCRSCNRFNYGEEKLFREALIRLHGEDVVEELEMTRYKHYKFDKVDRDMLKEKFKEMLKEI